ncbi:hypothetical protein MROS_0658 [Melioribacter roseus P3M-2]|uniref:Integral membrane protein n=1 Tax=Melioribacter roseus (strain DSM 23840 / JCM 17771 / VKM B-2668 / P3M-2) TaxID=1191523 RepID=I7A1W9_MELRP|nr:hypothetical protein [Melioribacter roseus]AFN73901.1 hypothetical protein MROS_0658 [Melioribacter roseus P3M-2]
MEFYPTLLTLHIIFAGGWLFSAIIDRPFKSYIAANNDNKSKEKLIGLYLVLTNKLGMAGAVGILLTGIIMVILNPGYGFFEFTSNHWLVSKQILTLVILLIIFVFIIPASKDLRKSINDNNGDPEANLKKIYKFNTIINILVGINFLFAITHRFFG